MMNRPFNLKSLAAIALVTSTILATLGSGASAGEVDARIRSALEQAGLKYEITSDSDFKVLIPCRDNRTQVVLINSDTSKINDTNLEFREVYALAYKNNSSLPADMSYKMMQESNRKKIGSWEIIKTSNGTNLVVFNAKISADTSSQNLAKIISSVGLVADEMEKTITTEDTF
ncbi:hypothetical protein [Chamaesiphon sp. VAR_48_metabat_403]|uniref:hypothetical protein n=1 Tax=Chamaesiphon sp. VAR_48_metabat_403 TaxID=2964700 RepID=UPI00286EACCB|nr:hypothetical protein [Chamaesiphon sp. VAR_48_metabat_403]